ncbi:hypothetical protein [Sinorhizobium meliloti]|uniref:hypothetical protein n=1 Tax=Rhizobium meliloti TaxID=382 RepID=UPI0013E31194|nr:hypothetical protein [Sinorhizobium meliloti]
MADPTKYVPAYSYSGWQATNPTRPLPADEVDNDFANIQRSMNQTIDAVKDVRRSDGKLANQSVGPDQLSPALTIGFTFTGLWVDGRSYSAGDGVVKDDTFYSAKVAHTADVSNAPGNDAYWNELYSLNDIVVTGGMALPRDSFVGDGTTTAFTLSFVPLSKFNLFVQVGGVVQSTDAYSSNGNTLTFASPPPNGYGIEVRGFATTAALVTPEDGSVSTAKLADGAVTTEKMADGVVTDAKLAAPANITYLNQTETTLDFYGGDVVEMFSVSPARKFSIGAGSIEFAETFVVPNGALITAEEGAIFTPTFEPVGDERNTPLIDLGIGCDINYLKTHLVAGIDTIRTMVKVGGACRIGRYIATSVNLNNNRAAGAADALDAGALLIRGAGNIIGVAEIDMHDSAINIDNAFRTTIGRVIETNFVTGIAGRDSSIVAIGSVYAEGVDPAISLAMSTPRGNMTPGANAIVWGGVERVTVGDVEAYNILEHTIRLGAKQPSGTITNERHSYGNIKTFAPYGCGFKMDDADAFTIKRVQIKTLYTEDVGHNVWGQPNDGNKAGCAVRNAEFVQIGLYMNRAVNYANSGNDGLWVEKSKNVQIAGADVQNARGYGVLVNPNGSDIDHVTITGIRSAFNGKSGVGVIPASNNNIRGVYLQGVSSNNTEYGVEVTARTDGTSPFVTEPTAIAVTVRNNTLGGKSVADVVAQDGDFFDEIVDRNPSFSATKGGTPQTAIPSATITAVAFGTEVRDVGGYFASSAWTPPRGRYDISAAIEFTAGIVAGEAYTILIRVAGATVSENFVRAQGTTSLQVAIRDIIEVDGTQAISISCFGGGAGDKTISGATSKTYFRGEKLSGLTV